MADAPPHMENDMDKCEECGKKAGQYVQNVFMSTVLKRPNGRNLCPDCDALRVRAMSPTGLMRVQRRAGRVGRDRWTR